jgi:uncharacterized protein (TIGR02597 family)
MKTSLKLITSVASFAALLTGAFAQTTAVTDPVGYITMPITQASGGAPGVSFIGATLVNKVEYQAAVAIAGSGSSITLPSSAGPFGLNSISQPAFYLEITSGPDAGKWASIASQAGNVLTLSDPIGGSATVGTSVVIRKHHTFNSVFGSTEATLTVHGGVDLNSADEVQILIPGSGPVSYFYNLDDLNPIGWTNVGSGLLAGDEVIAPGDGLKVIRRNPAVKPSIVQVGHVKTGPTQFFVDDGVNIITIPLSTGFAANEAQYLATGLLGGIDQSAADVFEIFAGGVGTSYFQSTDDLNPGLLPGNVAAPEGTSVRINRQAGGEFMIKFPAQVITTP